MAGYIPLSRAARGIGAAARGCERNMREFEVGPNPSDPRLTRKVAGRDQTGTEVETAVTVERPLTVYLNGQEIVTMMTIGDHPEWLAVGYLLNQNMLQIRRQSSPALSTTTIWRSWSCAPSVRPTTRRSCSKKIADLGMRPGNRAFGDIMETFEETVTLDRATRCLRTSVDLRRFRSRSTPHAQPLSGGGRDPRLRACARADRPLLYHGGCRPA